LLTVGTGDPSCTMLVAVSSGKWDVIYTEDGTNVFKYDALTTYWYVWVGYWDFSGLGGPGDRP
jgi:hypothetical protein